MRRRRKILIGAVVVIFLLITIPLIAGIINDAEIYELNNETRSKLEGQFIELSDGFVHYELRGPEEAQTVILIHGNAAPYFSWDYNVDALVNAGFRVLRYDIYGHGFSDRPKTEFDPALYDRQLVELLDALEIEEPVDVVGTSQGGSIATHFTAEHPEKVRKLALLAPLMDACPRMGMMKVLTAPVIGEYIWAAFGDKMSLASTENAFSSTEKLPEFKEKYELQMQFKGWKRAKLSNMRNMDLEAITDTFKEVGGQNRQVLLLWGTADKSIPGDSIDRMREVIPGIEYHKIEGAGHIVHYEHSEKVNPILIEFLKTGVSNA